MWLMKQSESVASRRRIPLDFVDATDGYTPETGVSMVASDIKISKNGGTQANSAGPAGEVGNGTYFYEFDSSELDTLGYVTVAFLKAGIRPYKAVVQVVAYDPYNGTSLGLSNVDAQTSTRLATSGYTAPPTVTAIRQEMDSNSTKLANLDVATSTLATPTQVRAQIEGELDEAGAELASIPSTYGSIRQKIDFLFQYFRNKRTITGTTETLFKEDGTTSLGTASISDDGTTFIRNELS